MLSENPAFHPPVPVSEGIALAYERIEAERERNCWIYVRPLEETLRDCRAVAARRDKGEQLPLYGVTFGVKDNIDVEGMPTSAACPAFSYMPERSARSVELLRDAGAICIGKTNLDQFATGLSGTRSPHGACSSVADKRFVSGGSSSGSAVAVAAGHVAFSLGTDTGGSGRIPAGFNGIVGIKPTVGRVSSRGLVPNCPTLDCVSIFANTVEDGARILEVVEGFDIEDPYSRRALPSADTCASFDGPFRFGRISAAGLNVFGVPECGALYESACDRLAALGGRSLAVDFAPFAEAGRLLFDGPWIAERRSVLQALIDVESAALLDITKAVLQSGAGYPATAAFASMHRLLRLRREVEIAFQAIDVLVVPTAPRPYSLAEMEREPVTCNNNLGYYSYFANLLDLCAVSVPNAVLANGVPMGVTLLAPAWKDGKAIALARRFEGCTGQAPFALRSFHSI